MHNIYNIYFTTVSRVPAMTLTTHVQIKLKIDNFYNTHHMFLSCVPNIKCLMHFIPKKSSNMTRVTSTTLQKVLETRKCQS